MTPPTAESERVYGEKQTIKLRTLRKTDTELTA